MAKKTRNANMEFLRMLSMCMVVMLHALGKSELLVNLASEGSANGVIAGILEALSISAVNIFILISGYFLIDSGFKLGRLAELIFQMLFYSIGAFVVCLMFGIRPEGGINTYFLLNTAFPVHMDVFWFLSSYVIVYVLLPVISGGVKAITKKQFATLIAVMLFFESILKTCLPIRFEGDTKGYDAIWFLTVFLIGAYIKLYGFKYLRSSLSGLVLYILATALIAIENFAIDFCRVHFGRFEEIKGVAYEYNHIFVLLAAIGLFACFLNKKEAGAKASAVICALSPMALGVYLFHENLSLRYNWQKWLGIYDSINTPTYLFAVKIIGAVLTIYVCGTVVDFIRIKLFALIKGMAGKKNET